MKRADRFPVASANGPFLAVAIPAGEHAIRLRYRPPGFAAGLGIAARVARRFSPRSLAPARRPPSASGGGVGGRHAPPPER